MAETLATSKSVSTAEYLRRIAADAQLVGYRSAAQVALLVAADEIERLRTAIEDVLAGKPKFWPDTLRAALRGESETGGKSGG